MSEERKLILKLGQMITDRIGHKVTVDDPEYWGLAEVLTDEMAEVCLSMKVRKPMTLEEIAIDIRIGQRQRPGPEVTGRDVSHRHDRVQLGK